MVYISLRFFVSFVANLAMSLIQLDTFSLTYSFNYSLDLIAAQGVSALVLLH